ncbi:MAG TPA: hypothetical protein VK433_11440 [Stellaceae bacterium]|nr:hypothetical protein [Stellaceae bacterium]
MSAIDFIHVTPQDRYEAASVGDAPRKAATPLVRALRGVAWAISAFAVVAGLVAIRILVFAPTSLHLNG